ncbi:amino acid/polyamine/organocation transporter (APC superfamily) [Arcticibacter pallidicorallinus]|uniref:Amino acid/polyamine/organocation transporter (APC superfamily) n=1 Tax=Arcticibacter pallidicorallinus TaxID=1259464 RepID=A0A2T0U126_9SPHI|nr:amino acid permease [Arcticibacter pallidicorallinus]PRY51605.1 amino acid/polyamine/organocation transporter (APC superfamily) [Arcticibacter pallidicorallinus]
MKFRKPLGVLMKEAEETGEGTLKRTLGAGSLVALGIGAIIGAGLFVRTAAAAADHAGPSVTLSFILAAVGCGLAGLCYAEFASMIPIAGSAYTYSYATMGEVVAWVIGWDLVLEYAVGAATVSIAWSEYLNKLLETFGVSIPYELCHSPFQVSPEGVNGIINLPALFIVILLSLVLIRGTKESANINGIIVILKVAIVIAFILLGWSYINPVNHTPYIPVNVGEQEWVAGNKGFLDYFENDFGKFGMSGIISGAGVVFFAFIGFDAVSTAAQEAKNPKKDMPIGILVSLVICTVLYVLFSHVLTGVANYSEFATAGKEASVAFAIERYMPGYEWLSILITVAILAGFSSVILVMLLGQSRVFFSMSRDGLVPKIFSEVHPKYQTPYKSNLIFLVFVGLFAAFVPGDVVGDMTSIGTLFAFVLVCIGVIVMRRTDPHTPRAFKTPGMPYLPIIGALACLLMMIGLGKHNWERLIIWMALGFVIYFAYSVKHSVVRKQSRKDLN